MHQRTTSSNQVPTTQAQNQTTQQEQQTTECGTSESQITESQGQNTTTGENLQDQTTMEITTEFDFVSSGVPMKYSLFLFFFTFCLFFSFF